MKGLTKIGIGSGLLVALAGCGGGSAGIVGQQQPRVRLFNAIDGESSISATYQDDTLKNLGTSTAAAYGSDSNDTIIANTNATATVNDGTGTLFTTASSLFRIGDYYSIYAGGSKAAGYKNLVLQDSQSNAPSGSIGLRVVHVGLNTGPVDVFFQPALIPQTGNTALFNNMTYGSLSAAANSTVAVDANGYALPPISANANYQVGIQPHGGTTLIASVDSQFTSGNYYTVVVLDNPSGGTSVEVIADHRTD